MQATVGFIQRPVVWLTEVALYTRSSLATTQAAPQRPAGVYLFGYNSLALISRRLQVLTFWELINSIELAVNGVLHGLVRFTAATFAFPRLKSILHEVVTLNKF